MLFIIADDIPSQAKDCLQNYGEVIEFSTYGITYKEVSNHPDIFFCKADDSSLIYAPNTPQKYIEQLKEKGVTLIKGESPVGMEYPCSAIYNAVVTEKYTIHKTKISDTAINKICANKKRIYVNQGYCRCSLLPLKNESFITSDKGIYKKLLNENIDALLVDPHEIILPGREFGFIGGTAGISDDKVFFLGSLKHYPAGEKIQDYLSKLCYQIVELYDGPLYDGGSITIVNEFI